MPDEPEVIRQQMEQTRSALTEKLETLEQQVTETVSGANTAVVETVESVKEAVQETVGAVKGTVQETMDSVREAFDLSRQLDRHPLIFCTGAFGLGYLAGNAWKRSHGSGSSRSMFQDVLHPGGHVSRLSEDGGRREMHERSSRPAQAQAAASSSAASWTAAPSNWMHFLSEQFGSEIDKAKGLALGTLFGVVRDFAAQTAPETMRQRVTEVINDFTRKMGGEVIEGPVLGEGQQGESSSRAWGEMASPRHEASRSHGAAQPMVSDATRQKWQGRWDQFRGRAKQHWGNLTDDDFTRSQGNVEQMVGIIRERTGETREEIERKLNS